MTNTATTIPGTAGARSIQHDTLAGYRDAKAFGSMAAIFNAAGRDDPRARAILAGMESDSKGESNGYGYRACIKSALAGTPYATIRVDAVTIADVV